MSTIEIRKVASKKDLKAFIELHYELYKNKGIECELFYADKSEGDYKLEHVFNISYPERPESIKANQGMVDYFRRYMR